MCTTVGGLGKNHLYKNFISHCDKCLAPLQESSYREYKPNQTVDAKTTAEQMNENTTIDESQMNVSGVFRLPTTGHVS